MQPQKISISNYTYHLPEEKIAKYPLQKRDESKLLIYKNGKIATNFYKHLANEIPEKSLLVFNNTKVVEARLLFTKNTGSVIEIFCLEPAEMYNDITTAMLQKQKVLWKCLVGGAKKWKDETLIKNDLNDGNDLILYAKKIEKYDDSFLIEFSWTAPTLSFAEVLHYAGKIPLPPYLNRDVEKQDATTYQTIYAKFDGSVAAPTAGLHFTENVFNNLAQKNIATTYVTLHVGAGTFKPVKAATMQQHIMHSEFIEVDIELIEKLLHRLEQRNKIVAVGTTSLRTLESLYWLGIKVGGLSTVDCRPLTVNQWECYELPQHIEPVIALENLLQFLKKNNQPKLFAKTQILIAPSYNLKIVDGLITNFHQPNSTLLLLVASIVGDSWKTIYDYALQNDFRFLSYGDGCLLWK